MDLLKHIDSRSKKDIYVTIEGNISSGKSTFIQYFKEIHNIELLQEPIELWEDFHGTNILKQKYDCATEQNEYIFQTLANMSRLQQLITTGSSNNTIKIMERSLQSSFHVFVTNSKENANIGHLTYELLKYNYEVCTQGIMEQFTNPDLVVYIKSTPEICMMRLKSRDRSAERMVDHEYLTQIHNAHEKWLIPNAEGKISGMNCRILTINGNQTQDQMKKEVASVLKEILSLSNQ